MGVQGYAATDEDVLDHGAIRRRHQIQRSDDGCSSLVETGHTEWKPLRQRPDLLNLSLDKAFSNIIPAFGRPSDRERTTTRLR